MRHIRAGTVLRPYLAAGFVAWFQPMRSEAMWPKVPFMTEHPHHARDDELVQRLEDAAFLLTLFSGVAIVVAILLLFVVL
jgi:hypothetical protein